MNLAQRVGQEFKTLRDNELALKADKATTLSGYGITDAVLKDVDIGTTVQEYNANTTIQGNTFNGSNQLVKLDIEGKLPAIDGSQLTGVSTVSDLNGLSDVVITNPVTDQVIKYDGTNWVNADGSTTDVLYSNPSYIATEGQTTFNVTYDVGFIIVYINGLKVDSSDYTAINGTSIVLNTGVPAGTLVDSVAFKAFSIADVYSKTEVDTIVATKQNTLVSGTNIKTVNGTSVLGSGNIATPTTTINNTLTSTSTTEALSAAQGKVLQDGKLGVAGGTMTGAITSLREVAVAMGANNIDLATGNLFTKTITTATTLTVSNVPAAGQVGYMILQLTNGGSAAVTWFSGVKWAGGTAPTLTASGKDILSFYTIDAGTTWNIVSIQKDVK